MPDPWTNQVVSQVIVGQAGSPQIEIGEVGGIGKITFPDTAVAMSNIPTVSSTFAGGFVTLQMSGPALSATGFEDWVTFVMRSNNGSGTSASMQFGYIDTNGNPTTVAQFNANGWSFGSGTALPLAVPTGYPLGGSPTTTQLATTLNSLIANLIAANIIT